MIYFFTKHDLVAYQINQLEETNPEGGSDFFLKGQLFPKNEVNDYVHSNPVSKYVTNNTRCFIIPQGSSTAYNNSFFVQTISQWNNLDNNVVNAGSVDQFKSQLKNII